MSDDYAWWRAKLAGEKPLTYEAEPQCGYFRVRDRRGLNKHLAPIKRPWIAAAIWRAEDGSFKAEVAGSPTDIENAWPYIAKHPITYEHYQFWHQHERWPEEPKKEKAA